MASLVEIKAEIKQAETELQKIAYEIANFDALKKAATSKVEETSKALEAAKQKLEQKRQFLKKSKPVSSRLREISNKPRPILILPTKFWQKNNKR